MNLCAGELTHKLYDKEIQKRLT